MIPYEMLCEHDICGLLEEVDELEVANLLEGILCGCVG